MSLRRRPHTVTVYPISDDVQPEGSVFTPVRGAASSPIECQITTMETDRAFQEWGVELNRGHKLLANSEDQGSFTHGSHVVWGTRVFKVKAAPQRREAGVGTDHVAVLLEELDYAWPT